MTRKEFILQAVLAQMQGHPVLGTDYMNTTGVTLVKNAEKVADAVKSYFDEETSHASAP